MSRKSYSEVDTTRRILIAGGVGGAIFSGITARLAHLQIFNQQEFADKAEENLISRDPAPSRRGLIFDRFGEPLATHRTAWNVFAARENVDDIPRLLDQIGKIVEISDDRRERILRDFSRERAFIPVPILSDLTYEQFAALSVERPYLMGASIEANEARSYPRGRDFAHVIGYVARPNQKEIDAAIEGLDREKDKAQIQRIQQFLRHPNMRVGRLGIEREADGWLRGKPGFYRFKKNAYGRVLARMPDDDTAPKSGSDIYLTIDAGLQKAAIEHFDGESGAAVVMDVHNGDILALASTPTYDPNDFVNGISSADYSELRDDERAPLYHKAYDGVYPPGSTFKMVVGSAAMKAGVMKPTDRVHCGGHYTFGNRDFHCWKRGGHGSVNLHTALQGSCDVYFYEMARRVGAEKIAEEARAYGYGAVYELGMTGGSKGVVPDDAWKRANLGQPWYEGETLNYGIGQGYLTASPVHLAVMATRLAIGTGAQMMPRLIGQGPAVEDNTPYGTLPGKEIIDHLRAGMYAVTSEPGGTALRSGDLGLDGIRMAGKTGSAQVRVISKEERARGVIKNENLPRKLRDHALFVAFAPYENPRYAVSVVVEHGGSGSGMAAPVARNILREAFVRNSGRTPGYQVASTTSENEAG